jgi:hypothetical protein
MATLQRGRKHIQEVPEVLEVRSLSRSDLSVLAAPRAKNSIQNLRDTHHRVARAVAAGLRNDAICELTGYSLARVWTLQQDPSFKELIAHYRAIITAEFADAADPVIDYMRNNALKAQAMLSDKLDDAMEKNEFLPTRDLLGIAELGLDRTGYGKVNKNVNVNVDFAANLEAMRKRAAEVERKRSSRVIEAQASHAPQPQSSQGGGPTALSPDRPAASLRRL